MGFRDARTFSVPSPYVRLSRTPWTDVTPSSTMDPLSLHSALATCPPIPVGSACSFQRCSLSNFSVSLRCLSAFLVTCEPGKHIRVDKWSNRLRSPALTVWEFWSEGQSPLYLPICFLPPHSSPVYRIYDGALEGHDPNTLTPTAGWSMVYLEYSGATITVLISATIPRRWPLGCVTHPHHSPVSPPSVVSCPSGPTVAQTLGG